MFQHKIAMALTSTTIAASGNATIIAFDWAAFSWDSFFYSASGTPNYAPFDPIMIRRIRVKSYYFDGYWSDAYIKRDLQDVSFLKVAQISPVAVNEWLDLNMIVPGFGDTTLSGDYVHCKLMGSIYLENNFSTSKTDIPVIEAEIVYGEM